MTTLSLAKKIAQLMIEKKANNVVILDLRKLTSITDHFVICSGDSDTHVKAIADFVRDGMEKINEKVWHVEGYNALRWVVLDYVDVVAHVFYKDDRDFYNLERLWGDAKKIFVRDEASKRTGQVSSKKTSKTGKKSIKEE